MQKYRADQAETQGDGAVVWCAQWIGGPSLARIDNCRLVTISGDPRATVYITGEADSFFSIPAACYYKGARVRGYVTSDDGEIVFRHTTPARGQS